MTRLADLRALLAILPAPLKCDLDVYDEEILEIRAGIFDEAIRLLFTCETGFTNKSSAEWDSARQSEALRQAEALCAMRNSYDGLIAVAEAAQAWVEQLDRAALDDRHVIPRLRAAVAKLETP